MGGVAGVATLSRACWDSLEVCGGFPCRHPPSCVSSPAGVFVRTRTFRKRMRERERLEKLCCRILGRNTFRQQKDAHVVCELVLSPASSYTLPPSPEWWNSPD